MNRYSVRRDAIGEWVSMPNNSGELAPGSDTVNELNRLLGDLEVARDERDRLTAALRELHDAPWLDLPGRAGDIIEQALSATEGKSE